MASTSSLAISYDVLERGEGISPALMKAIEESKISVKKKGRKVLPIFYRVNPSDVRKQTGKFGEAFGKVKENSKHSLDVVEKWRTALMEAGNLSGWVSSDSRPESQLCEEVADHILKKLYPISFTASTGLVGIDSHVDKIMSLLCIEPTSIRVIGIWGMGGIGKTTIAEILFSRICNQFDCFCFLRNVREKSEKYGLVDLRKSFFSELLGIEIRNLDMLSVVPPSIKDSLNRKKVLAVLDDVNDPEQLEALAVNDDDCFGLGSRIILISRDKQVLSSAEKIYEVKGLDFSDALQLLSMKAFKQNHPPVEYRELSKRVENYCKGVPLALKVLGSYLCGRTSKEWESALNKLKVSPDYNILKVLKVSYNALDRMEKSIFLDIACFFKGYDKSWVEDILDDWAIIRLVDHCLITIVHGKLEMHDLIVEMGQDIARRKGNRLWISTDICQMLATIDNKAKKVVEGLFLDISTIGRVYLNPAVFSRMHNLRLLKFYWSSWLKKEGTGSIFESSGSDCLKSLPNKLRFDAHIFLPPSDIAQPVADTGTTAQPEAQSVPPVQQHSTEPAPPTQSAQDTPAESAQLTPSATGPSSSTLSYASPSSLEFTSALYQIPALLMRPHGKLHNLCSLASCSCDSHRARTAKSA
ncbi:disease resistance protein RUN1-like [Hevea brasiliensis]|uniref:disease resistance protein RUN1-like n=1 Tax=Hevea brasiliensis TaxID=3981 RepID=UPI0025D6A555|nr:disease resistance protein RUN1-like [Hevea brasiliensis]